MVGREDRAVVQKGRARARARAERGREKIQRAQLLEVTEKRITNGPAMRNEYSSLKNMDSGGVFMEHVVGVY